jgi:hypothetical protein
MVISLEILANLGDVHSGRCGDAEPVSTLILSDDT